MLARSYLIGGLLLLGGYGLTCWQGWEFGSAVRLSPAPAVGAVLHSTGGQYARSSSSSSSSSSSGSRSGWVIFGGK